MNVRILIGSLVFASLTVGLGRAAEQRPLANFKITVAVNPQKNEVALKCREGCAWTDLTFSCKENEECSSPIDEYGMTNEH